MRKHKIAHKKLLDQSNTDEKSDKAVRLENIAITDDLERIKVVLIEDGNETSIGTAVIIGEPFLICEGEQAAIAQSVNSGEHMEENLGEHMEGNDVNTGYRNNNDGAEGSELGGINYEQ